MINIGIIGLGYWGPNLLRNFLNNKKCYVSAICDTNKSLLNKYKNKHPEINCYTDYKKLAGGHRPSKILIRDSLKREQTTTIKILEMKSKKFRSSLFNQRNLGP